jgi:hypothetical protein
MMASSLKQVGVLGKERKSSAIFQNHIIAYLKITYCVDLGTLLWQKD